MVPSRIVTHKASSGLAPSRQTVHGVPDLGAGVFNQGGIRAGIADSPGPFAREAGIFIIGVISLTAGGFFLFLDNLPLGANLFGSLH